MLATPVGAGTTLHLERSIAASRERVFEAWTNPELFARWFTPPGGASHKAEIDLRAGGSWRVTMRLRPRLPPARAFGTYLEVDPPARLVYTLAWRGAPFGPESLVTVEFQELDGATRIKLTQERLETRRGRAFHAWGWRHSLRRLIALLEGS
jgi:uncharacterized protein YndB with AHSA1/START domain